MRGFIFLSLSSSVISDGPSASGALVRASFFHYFFLHGTRTEFPLWRHAAWVVRVHEMQVLLRQQRLDSCGGSRGWIPLQVPLGCSYLFIFFFVGH